jgi:cbb3-type cytochrome oxidase subunit 3
MKSSIKKVIFSLFLGILVFFGMQTVQAAYNHYGLDVTTSIGNVGAALSVSDVGNSAGTFLSQRTGQIIGAILSFIGVIFLVLIIYAGILWMTASGNDQQVDKAKKLIIAAIIGLIIILAAYAITAFIGNQLMGSSSTGSTTPTQLTN